MSFTDPDFISNISEDWLVFVSWIFMGLMSTVSSLSLQMVNFTQEAGGLASFTRSNGACSSIAVKICFACLIGHQYHQKSIQL